MRALVSIHNLRNVCGSTALFVSSHISSRRSHSSDPRLLSVAPPHALAADDPVDNTQSHGRPCGFRTEGRGREAARGQLRVFKCFGHSDAHAHADSLVTPSHSVSGPEELDIDGGRLFFSNRLCPFAHRAWWAMHEKGVAREYEYIHIELGEAKPAWFKGRVSATGTGAPLVGHGQRVHGSRGFR